MRNLLTHALLVLLVTAAATNEPATGSVGQEPVPGAPSTGERGIYTDERDGELYSWVRIGYQQWMVENLRFVTNEGSWCWNNDAEQCEARGRLYVWDSAVAAIPKGWRLPTDDDWKALEVHIGIPADSVDLGGDRGDSAGRLKAEGEWPEEFGGREIPVADETSFHAVPTGVFALGEFTHDGYTVWWTSTQDSAGAWIRVLRFFDNRIDRVVNNKAHAFAVRCVRDAPREDPKTE